MGKRRYSVVIDHDVVAEKPRGYMSENAPAEIVMSFSNVGSVPSETKLNTMFKHFGRLKESETEIDYKTSRARVVFKKCCDAEVAFDSAVKLKVFGSMAVSFQLNYAVSEAFKADSTLFEETRDLETVLGEGSHLVSPKFGEEGSFAVSHFGDDAALPMPVPITEETLHLVTSLGEVASPVVADVSMSAYEEASTVVTTIARETKPIVN